MVIIQVQSAASDKGVYVEKLVHPGGFSYRLVLEPISRVSHFTYYLRDCGVWGL